MTRTPTVLLAALLLALTACSTAAESEQAAQGSSAETASADPDPSAAETTAGDPGSGEEYVALGDSYTAAFQTGPSDATDGCYRSRANYPHLIAAETGATLTDVSCGGATSRALANPQRTLDGNQAPPQFDALSEDTDLVTLRIGGNDFDLFTTLALQCVRLAQQQPEGSPCREANAQLLQRVDEIEQRLAKAIAQISRRAPGAQVLAVGYPEIVPASGRCDLLPLAEGDYPFARELNLGFNEALRGAAEATGATYVDVFEATSGHHICADEPWVAGVEVPRGNAIPYHPYPEEQEAAAEAVLAALAE
ncbi:SGNH/GDSL hydrolase family protein [Nocardioides panacisoli]|uniref:SGNH/GDSL hydrolase family protein n=1 Tax=Nocardioides panacisoli TaxID=627624 RepID=UPI001C636533|nr:SGNH/GDSL hydrolase family protein [Nocardioides panacisoli]QYJ03951.1 SGNH/GDSL hydrolase family protein [Nocardioides panacisoli]